ncbi:hypothetical protein FA95DRAFT_1485797 [Auriscalpium vulgare]|uniref:Uncharacterized protein n=1 Tax=Auriscalpium vulgare TaxID=40419 RepID=A0ACB8S4E6_9AGAM|nr:hypothetical protein FA95DRAFT_1485797 [Auriscalpium vulgare]
MLLDTLVHRLQGYPELLQTVSLAQLIKYISLSAALRQDICFAQPAPASPDGPPPTYLPPAVCSFLSEATGIPYGLVQDAWHIVRYDVWLHPGPNAHAALVQRALEEHGLKVGIATVAFYPPHFHCINPLCGGRQPALRKQQARQVVAFTLADGARPAWAINLYCHHCHTTYHHNFYLHAGQRIYYAGIPDFLQVGEHQFVDSGLAALWTDLMVVSWVSATNCARSYEMSLSKSETRPDDWQFSFTLTTEQVWDAFVILALLRDHERRGELLHIPHTGDQRDRFMAAMEHRNTRIVKEGQPELRHYCDRCIRFYEGPDPDAPLHRVQPIVVDGITLGHPCCGVFRCRVPLANNRHRFCPPLAVGSLQVFPVRTRCRRTSVSPVTAVGVELLSARGAIVAGGEVIQRLTARTEGSPRIYSIPALGHGRTRAGPSPGAAYGLAQRGTSGAEQSCIARGR